ncbi:MAG TPA: AgmX/PglI C-terminal domain-containing protein [Polyangiaceae bacterium]|nr:AgmX/PglI C-terminal domain-containing protein [Polyangiaceae bacterium]
MSSEIPKQQTAGGHKVFIALTLILLSATAGLIVWKFTGGSGSDPVATIDTAPTTEYERPADNPLPPPPPPPPAEEPSAAPSAQSPTNAPVRSGKSACSGTCEGEATGALKAALAGRGGAGRRCYEKSLSQNATLRGRMTVHVRVGSNGSVCSANVSHDELHDPGLSNCILGVFRSSSLPEPSKGCVDVDVPLNFVPNK